jgi:hypothetical protein
MRSLVVYESFFGNTGRLAESIAAGLRSADDQAALVQSVRGAPPSLDGVDLLIVGAPTHFLTLSSPLSRWLQAQYWGDPSGPHRSHRPYGRPASPVALRDWLRRLPPRPLPPTAVFDTRMRGRGVGGAGPAIAECLHNRGHQLVRPPAAFYVQGIGGPLAPGESERAVDWGRSVARAARAGQS